MALEASSECAEPIWVTLVERAVRYDFVMNSKKVVLLLFGVVLVGAAWGQTVSSALMERAWPARWVTHPSASPTDFGVFHFRKTFPLASAPGHFVVHISADNRYRLYVNGQSVSTGPAQSDLANWRFETVDLAPYLHAGSNVLAAVVWNGGVNRPMAQISHRTGFLLQADDLAQQVVNTDASWKVVEDKAYRQIAYKANDPHFQWNYYIAGPGERLEAAKYPWGWEQSGFDDKSWFAAEEIANGVPFGVENGERWQLKPRSVPMMTEDPQRYASIARSEGIEASPGFLQGTAPLHIPANSKVSILMDQGTVTTGYPVFRVGGGNGARIDITYSEALYDSKGEKGNRNEFAGKHVMGPEDEFLADGEERVFQPLWTRNWRWVQLDIQTKAEPLTLKDLYSLLCVYPARRIAVFESDSKDVQAVWDAAWLTLKLNAQETFISDIAWERLQYVADTKAQALTWLNLTGDDRLVRLAIEDFDSSRVPLGPTQARYPSRLEQFIADFPLYWVSMVHDYWIYRGDDGFTERFLPGIQNVLGWWEQEVAKNGEKPVRWAWNSPIADRLLFSLELQQSAELFDHFGKKCEADHFRQLAAQINSKIYASHFDPKRGLLWDYPRPFQFQDAHQPANPEDAMLYTQEVNTLGVLADAVPPDAQRAVMEKVLSDSSGIVSDPSYFMFFRFYVGRALKKTGLGDRYIENLAPWEDQLRRGMKTFGELATNPRSECHPWGTSPGYELLATVAGIEPATPGFHSVRIEPALGALRHVHALMPHPLGSIEVWFDRTSSGLHARVSLPQGLTGVFVWKGHAEPIQGVLDLSF